MKKIGKELLWKCIVQHVEERQRRNRIGKRILAIVLAVVTAVAVLPPGFSDGKVYAAEKEKQRVVDLYEGGSRTSAGKAYGKIFDKFVIEDRVLKRYRGSDKEVVIPEGVAKIGDYAFADCESLTNVTIPEGVISIGRSAFKGCDILESIKIPNSVTSVGELAFDETAWLANERAENQLVIAGQVVVSSGRGCSGNVNIPEGVTSIGNDAFNMCDGMSSVTIPEGVTSIGNNAFGWCTSLRSVEIPNSVISIEKDSFSNTPWLRNKIAENPLVIVNHIMLGGYECSGNVEIPEGVMSIGAEAFKGCYGLKSIEIPEGVTSIGDSAFRECINLENIQIPISVTSIGADAFWRCHNLKNIEIPDSVTSVGGGAFDGTAWLENKRAENPLVIGGRVVVDGKKCSGNVVIPEEVISIGAGAFDGCYGLECIEIPKGVISIGTGAFCNCRNMMTINVSEENEKYTSKDGCLYTKNLTQFIVCPDQKTKVQIPELVKSIEEFAFDGCDNITDIKIPKSVTSIGHGAFVSCENLRNVIISDGVRSIGADAFYDCKNLNSVNIPLSVIYIGFDAFCPIYGFEATEVYYAGSEEEWSTIYLGGDAFGRVEPYIHYNSKGSDDNESNDYGSSNIPGIPNNPDVTLENGRIELDEDFTACGLGSTYTLDGTFFFSKYLPTEGEVKQAVENITWTSSNPSVLEVAFQQCTSIENNPTGKAEFELLLTPHKFGKATITGTDAEGNTVSQEIVVEPEMSVAVPNDILVSGGTVTCLVVLDKADTDYLSNFINGIRFSYESSLFPVKGFSEMPLSINQKSESRTVADDGMSAVYEIEIEKKNSDMEGDVAFSFISANGQKAGGKASVDIETDVTPGKVLEAVKRYTTDDLYAGFDAIMDRESTGQEKFIELSEFFRSNGFTDPCDGISYISEATPYRSSYLYLTTNEIYCAYNWYDWLNNTKKGKQARALLWADGLLFNHELGGYVDPGTYVEAGSLVNPVAINKNKAMLKDFMEYSVPKMESLSAAKDTAEFVGNMLEVNEIKKTSSMDRLLKAIRNSKTEGECDIYTQQLAKLFEKQYEAEASVNKGSIFKVDLASSSFSGAFDTASKTVGLGSEIADSILTLVNMNKQASVYKEYEYFLTAIASSTDISRDMRMAAKSLLDDMENKYLNPITEILTKCFKWEVGFFLEAFDIDLYKKLLKEKFGEFAGNTSATVTLATYISNLIVDTGDFVKQAAYTQGYAEVSALFARMLEQDKEAFKNASELEQEEKAWKFYKDYNLLWDLRYKGEEQYLDMSGVRMLIFFDVKTKSYDLKESLVKEVLGQLSDRKFRFVSNLKVPESAKYLSKSTVSCPVDVNVYTEDGTLVATLKDGKESNITNKYGRFGVVYSPYSEEYIKVVCQSTEPRLRLEAEAVGEGLVNYASADERNDGILKTFSNVPVTNGDVITIDGSSASQAVKSSKSADGKMKSQEISMLSVDREESRKNLVEQIMISPKEKIEKGKTVLLTPVINPINTAGQVVKWSSSNEKVATVKNGVVKGVGTGRAVVSCMTLDEKVEAACEVTVVKVPKILPKATHILKVKAVRPRSFTLKWKKVDKSVTGYQIQYSTVKKFKKKNTITKTVKGVSNTKLNVTKLKPGKKYYVRIRTYKVLNEKNRYSAWSKFKYVTTKK